MPSKNPAQRLRDIVENIDAITAFTKGFDFDSFKRDRKRYMPSSALSRLSRKHRGDFPAELLNRHPEMDWAAISAGGNVYRHEYEAVDERLIWHTIRRDLPKLRSTVSEESER